MIPVAMTKGCYPHNSIQMTRDLPAREGCMLFFSGFTHYMISLKREV